MGWKDLLVEVAVKPLVDSPSMNKDTCRFQTRIVLLVLMWYKMRG